MLKKLFIIAILLKIYDLATTYYVVSMLGNSVEANPFVRSLIFKFGLTNALLIGMLIYTLVAIWLYFLARSKTLMLVILIMSIVAIINTVSVFSTMGLV